MINFLHTFEPSALLLSWGSFTIYWYGLMVVLGIIGALVISIKLSHYYGINNNQVLDISFYLIIFGILGARVYDILLEWPYYLSKPQQIFKIWEGGLAIHGAIIAGLVTLYLFARRYQFSIWRLSSLFVPGLAIGQAIGRWGNYFNQELFGKPTTQAWGIPIALENRPIHYLNEVYFHPTFFYESLGCLLIGLFLLTLNIHYIRQKKLKEAFYIWSTAAYMVLYSVLRFALEFIRLDKTPFLVGWRWPQVISLLIIVSFFYLLINHHACQKKSFNQKKG